MDPGSEINRASFPSDFVFGAATSAYQVEGAYNKGGKGQNNWDYFSLLNPDKIVDGSNGCVALEQYYRYKEDILLMKKVGLDSYRFSISWSRVLPGGRRRAGINKEGIKYYNDVIDFCKANGLEPCVTIFHFDVPQCLEDEYGGFLDSTIIEDFRDYADLCFWEFGDRVKHWVTVNEPSSYVINGYVSGGLAPGRGNAQPLKPPERPERDGVQAQPALLYRQVKLNLPGRLRNSVGLSEGDAGKEPYIVAHNLLIAHACAVRLYKSRYQKVQGGIIGITNQSFWYVPYDNTKDAAAASRALDFYYGWYVSPIVYGDYPASMKTNVGTRLPKFTDEERTMLVGSYDFLGINYYTANYVIDVPDPFNGDQDVDTFFTDTRLALTGERNHVQIGPNPGSSWLYLYPDGFYQLLKYTKENFNNPDIYVLENGMSTKDDKTKPVDKNLDDQDRVDSTIDHLKAMKQAMDDDGVKVKGYYMWSVLDNYEWAEGYTTRFGIFYVDYMNDLIRHPKISAFWWMNFLKSNNDPPDTSVKRIKESEETSTESGSQNRLKRTRH